MIIFKRTTGGNPRGRVLRVARPGRAGQKEEDPASRARHMHMLLPLLLAVTSSAAAEDVLDLLWPSPLLKFHDPLAQQQNAALKKLIMGVARNTSGVSKTNIGGWQSDVHFFERTEAPVAVLRTRAYHAIFRYLQVPLPAAAPLHPLHPLQAIVHSSVASLHRLRC